MVLLRHVTLRHVIEHARIAPRMSGNTISAEIIDFVRGSFRSVWALELLFLMRRENSRTWSVGELTRELRASESLVRSILPDFIKKGLVLETARNVFQYRPAVVELEQLVDRVAAAYAENRVRVINEIFRGPERSARSFADGFRFRKG
jgi:hypothetical protein